MDVSIVMNQLAINVVIVVVVVVATLIRKATVGMRQNCLTQRCTKHRNSTDRQRGHSCLTEWCYTNSVILFL